MKKRITGLLLCFLLLLGLSSCGKHGARYGYPYYYYKNYTVGGVDYSVYKPEDINNAIYYEINESKESVTASLWKVNTQADLSYEASREFSQEEKDELYAILISETIFNDLSFPYEIRKSGDAILEGDISNPDNEEIHYAVFVAYCSFLLRTNGESIYIGIPVYEKIIGITESSSDDPFSGEKISYATLQSRYGNDSWSNIYG